MIDDTFSIMARAGRATASEPTDTEARRALGELVGALHAFEEVVKAAQNGGEFVVD